MVLRRHGDHSGDQTPGGTIEVELTSSLPSTAATTVPLDPDADADADADTGADAGTSAATEFDEPYPRSTDTATDIPAGSRRGRDRVDRRSRRRRPRASLMLVARIALVGLLGIALSRLGARAFDEWVLELTLVPALVTAVALVARRWRLVWRAVAGALAIAVATIAVGLIGGATWTGMAGDLVDGPQRLVTTEWPSPLDAGVSMLVALGLGIVVAVAADLAGRPRLHTAPLIVLAIGFASGLAVAAPVRPGTPLLAAIAGLALLLLLARPGEDPRTRARLLSGERSFVAALIGIVVAGLVTASSVAWSDRADPRRDVTPEQTLSLLFPVQQMIALRDAEPAIPLFRITDRSALAGPSLPTRWRLSALAEFDGQRWLPALTLRPIGGRLGLPDGTDPGATPPITFELEILTDDIALVPLPGDPIELDIDSDVRIQTDAERTVVLLDEAPEPGTTASVRSEVAPSDIDADAATIANRPVDEISKTFEETAREIAGEGTLLEQLRQIESTMQDDWLLDNGAPGAGLQLALMETFVQETQRGSREQFVTAFVFFARSLGIDARIATGFVVPPGRLGSPLTLTSAEAAVWPEVRLGEGGWVAFEPVPAEETTDEEPVPDPPSQQSPAAAQPPIAPPNEQTDETPPEQDEPITDIIQGGLRTWVARAGVGVGVTVVPVLLVCGSILLLKWKRRRRRLQVADSARRVVGAWANAADSLVDAGLTIAPSWTDDRIAEQSATFAPSVPHEIRRLAAAATAMTFGRTERGAFIVDDAIATSNSIDDAIRAERSRWQRIRWRLSLRSLRKATRSPIQP
jgi:protein-glutamine gamma-glutamyltransferase